MRRHKHKLKRLPHLLPTALYFTSSHGRHSTHLHTSTVCSPHLHTHTPTHIPTPSQTSFVAHWPGIQPPQSSWFHSGAALPWRRQWEGWGGCPQDQSTHRVRLCEEDTYRHVRLLKILRTEWSPNGGQQHLVWTLKVVARSMLHDTHLHLQCICTK